MSAFWDWAVEAYARPGAAEACLALQDEHGQNVPLMLWVVWRCRTGTAPGPQALDSAAVTARAWDEVVIRPLRTVRRRLREPLEGPSAEAREAFRERVKALELEAERLLMEALEALDGARGAGAEDELLARAAASYGAPAPPAAFADLLARL